MEIPGVATVVVAVGPGVIPGRIEVEKRDSVNYILLRFHRLVSRWRDGSCQKSYGDAPNVFGIGAELVFSR